MGNDCHLTRRSVLGAIAMTLAAPFPALAQSSDGWQDPSAKVITYREETSTNPITVEVLLRGKGPLVVLLPSLGRGASDFNVLSARIAAAGFRTAAINPPGIGKSTRSKAVTLADYARDVFEVIKALTARGKEPVVPAVLIGHAYGNRLARAVAARYPQAVSSLILLASGGQVAMSPPIAKALFDVFDTSLSADAHISAVRTAFFAPGNDPEVWRDGWYSAVALQQQRALRNSSPGSWSDGGEAPVYIIQAAQDAVASPANAEALRMAHPERVEVAILLNAGHAMLPEQPDQLAELVIGRLARLKNEDR